VGSAEEERRSSWGSTLTLLLVGMKPAGWTGSWSVGTPASLTALLDSRRTSLKCTLCVSVLVAMTSLMRGPTLTWFVVVVTKGTLGSGVEAGAGTWRGEGWTPKAGGKSSRPGGGRRRGGKKTGRTGGTSRRTFVVGAPATSLSVGSVPFVWVSPTPSHPVTWLLAAVLPPVCPLLRHPKILLGRGLQFFGYWPHRPLSLWVSPPFRTKTPCWVNRRCQRHNLRNLWGNRQVFVGPPFGPKRVC